MCIMYSKNCKFLKVSISVRDVPSLSVGHYSNVAYFSPISTVYILLHNYNLSNWHLKFPKWPIWRNFFLQEFPRGSGIFCIYVVWGMSGPKQRFRFCYTKSTIWAIPVVVLSRALVCGRSLAGIVGSNSAWGLDFCLLSMLCIVR
jgi:hypothetical protein